MAKYKGISTKKLKNEQSVIMVRFKYLGKIYPIKNFTKLFGCDTEKQAFDKLGEIKAEISKGKNPFGGTNSDILTDLVYKKIEDYKDTKWRYNTYTQYKYFYDKNIKKEIGHLRISKIKYEHISRAYNKIEHLSLFSKKRFKNILQPVFDEAMKMKEIYENPLNDLIVVGKNNKLDLNDRINESEIKVVRKLYKAILEYKGWKNRSRENETIMYFLLCLLSAHRYGELIKLEKKDIDFENKMIVSPKEITKTKVDYHFPIPKECYEYLKNCDDGLVFPNLIYKSMSQIFNTILRNSDIKFKLNQKITIHDMRSLMLNIMIKECNIDSRLADYCLEYKERDVIKHYLSFNYFDKKKAFKKYWKKIRKQDLETKK